MKKYNTGDYNTGECNTGDYNTGDYNTGYYNTGDYNLGNCNSGYYNTGNCNAGNYNTCNYETGYFNTKKSNKIRVFNKEIDRELYENCEKPKFIFFNLTEWISENEMSDYEKENNPNYKTTRGYLKKYDYKEAFRKSYYDLDKDEREKQIKLLKALPNFDADIFFEISGIRIYEEVKKKIIIDGKEIEISEESFDELKKSLVG